MVPSVTYAIEFARMTTTQLEQLDAIIARVLRRALGLPKHAPTKAVLVECGIPFMEVTRHCSLLKFLARFEKRIFARLRSILISMDQYTFRHHSAVHL